MQIAIGCDHRGYDLKQHVIKFVEGKDHRCKDFGAFDTASMDYPDVAIPLARAVGDHKYDLGILICFSGIGMSIAANKIKGVRAALCHEPVSARLCRQHNNANVLCLGGGIIGVGMAEEVVSAFLATEFEGGRHANRLCKIADAEQGSSPQG